MSAFPGVTQEEWDSLLEGIVHHQYHLLIGAGINSDCIGGDGKPIPDSPTLINQLVSDFQLETDGEIIDLKRAYENIENSRDTKGRTRHQYFKERFSNCSPKWQDIIFHIDWKRVWTLNIDDVLENAFNKFTSTNLNKGKCRSFSWNEPFIELSIDSNIVPIVHLHGYSHDSENLIFSILEYLKASARPHTWHPVFGDDYLQEPFVIIGTKMRDEIDLHEFITRGNQSKNLLGRPSIIVLKEMSKFQRKEFVKWGLIPIESDSRTFLEFLIPELSKLESKMGETLHTGTTTLPKEAKVFLGQFRSLTPDKEIQLIPFGHDFYAGDEPLWADVLNDFDVRFESTDIIKKEILSILNNDTYQRLYYISADAGSGKTAVLYRIVRDLIATGKNVFMFRGEERFSSKSVLWWLKRSPNSVLIFDNVADFMSEIVELCALCRSEKVNLLIIAAERTRREGLIVQELEYTFLQKYKNTRLGYLSDSDIEKLIEKLKSQGRLGQITRKFIGEQRYYFRKTSNRELFPAMADLERGIGFINRIVKEFNDDIKSAKYKRLYALVCISHSLGYALPISIVSSAVGININEIMNEVSHGQLLRIVVLDSKGLKARHRVFASNIIERAFNQDERFELLKALAVALSPHISISAIQQKTLYYRIIRELMDERIVTDWLGHKLAQQFYDDLLPYYDWDARYWEQRALAEVRMNHLNKAMSYAETAVARNRDPFTLNTLGTIMLKIANSPLFSNATSSIDSYWKGVGYLRDSVELANSLFPHPFTTFFSHTLRYVLLHHKEQEVDRRIIREWEWWMERAKHCVYYKSEQNASVLADDNTNWLKLVTH